MAQSVFKTKVEKHVKPRLFPRVTKEGNEDTSQYKYINIKDCQDKEIWSGQPFLADIWDGFDKKKKEHYYSAAMQIIDHETKEILRMNIYVNGLEDEVTFKEGTAGYELIKSIDGAKENTITMSFEELQMHIYDHDTAKAIVHEHWNMDHSRNWFTMEITEMVKGE